MRFRAFLASVPLPLLATHERLLIGVAGRGRGPAPRVFEQVVTNTAGGKRAAPRHEVWCQLRDRPGPPTPDDTSVQHPISQKNKIGAGASSSIHPRRAAANPCLREPPRARPRAGNLLTGWLSVPIMYRARQTRHSGAVYLCDSVAVESSWPVASDPMRTWVAGRAAASPRSTCRRGREFGTNF